MNVRVAYDARSLEPQARHAGVGVVITNIRDRLGSEFSLQAISHNFEGAQEMGVRTWPVVPKMNNIMFECSGLLCSDADLYWATNTYIPMFLRKTAVATVHDLLLLKYPGDERNGRILADRFISSIKRARVIISDSVTTANDLMQVFPQCKRKIEVGL